MVYSNQIKQRTWSVGIASLVGLGLAFAAGCGPGEAPGHSTTDVSDNPRDTGVDTDAGQPDTSPEGDTDASPVVELSVEQIKYEDVRQDSTEEVEVRIRNVGGEATWIEDVRVEETGTETGPDHDEFKVGGKADDTPFHLEPSVHETITVTYAPTDFATDQGMLIVSMRHDQPNIEVPIETISAYADLQMPSSLRIGQVATGETDELLVDVTNKGLKPLTLRDMVLKNDDDFTVKYRSDSGRTTTKPFPLSLDRNEVFSFWVEYTAPDEETASTRLTVESDDPDDGSKVVSVTANRPAPCLEVETSELDFGKMTSSTSIKSLQMLNCNRGSGVEVESATLSSDGGGVFSLVDQPEYPFTLAPGETGKVKVQATLEESRTAVGRLVIRAKDAPRSPYLVKLTAQRE